MKRGSCEQRHGSVNFLFMVYFGDYFKWVFEFCPELLLHRITLRGWKVVVKNVVIRLKTQDKQR